MPDAGDLDLIMNAVAAQVDAFEKRQQSRAEKHYAAMTAKSAAALGKFARNASFDQLLSVEQLFQKNDLVIYAKVPSIMQAVQKGMRDFKAGGEVYEQLLTHPEAYRAHSYREDDHASPDKLVPLDAMRKALRGQIARVGNYRKTVLGSSQEYAFMTARIAMIRRAEKLYDSIQRDRLLPPE